MYKWDGLTTLSKQQSFSTICFLICWKDGESRSVRQQKWFLGAYTQLVTPWSLTTSVCAWVLIYTNTHVHTRAHTHTHHCQCPSRRSTDTTYCLEMKNLMTCLLCLAIKEQLCFAGCLRFWFTSEFWKGPPPTYLLKTQIPHQIPHVKKHGAQLKPRPIFAYSRAKIPAISSTPRPPKLKSSVNHCSIYVSMYIIFK